MKKSIALFTWTLALAAPSMALCGSAERGSLPPSVTSKEAAIGGSEFAAFFSNEANYDRVYWNVMGWFGSTKNGCVAFASTALRFLGASISIDTIYNGERVSLLTRPFSSFLENRLGWQRIGSSKVLKPGDLVFTVDEPSAPGYPAHVFMHNGYADTARTISLAVDNQDFTHERALAGDVKKDYSAFAYALRSPLN